MDYKVIITEDAETDMDNFLHYLLFEKKNEQAVCNLIDDFEATITSLTHVAESLKMCENQHLKKLGYRRMNFMSHRYFMLYRVEGDTVFVDNIFHELQDYENKMI
ncbi:MAG: type II toxin-antitoxin system RelE/ParE family toxin [Lachnospiraceae bacterium]|nr:type II toxin-antitoxin system RelE/ParE family toxin [Lachnospiraceae bacterium]